MNINSFENYNKMKKPEKNEKQKFESDEEDEQLNQSAEAEEMSAEGEDEEDYKPRSTLNENRDSSQRGDRDSYGVALRKTDREDGDAKNKLEDNFFGKLIYRFKDVLERGALSLQNTIFLNSELSMLKFNIGNNEEADRSYGKIKEKLRKIDQQTFNWKVDYRSLPYVKQIFSFVDIFHDNLHFVTLDYQKIQEILSPECFLAFMKEPYHSYDEHDKVFFQVTEFHSLVMATFRKLYISFPMAARPRLFAGELNLLDPFIREHYRLSNREYFVTSNGLPPNFNLMEFLKGVMEKFVFSGLPRWEQKNGEPILVPLLGTICECFDYGLIGAKECDLLLSQLYMISELLSSLENQIKRKYLEYQNIVEKYLDEFMSCRISISKIVVHIICVYCDYDYQDSVKTLKANPNAKEILKYFLQDKKAAYSNISLIILKYLSPKLEIGHKQLFDKVLEHNISLIFNFIGDYENDFFTQSLCLIKREYIPYYLSPSMAPLDAARVSKLVQSMSSYMAFTRSASVLNKELFISRFKEILDDIRALFASDQENIELRLETSKYNIPALLLQIIDYLDRSGINEQNIITDGISSLGLILRHNYSGQSVLFTGPTFTNYRSIFLRRYLATMNMLQMVFNNDYSMFNLTNRVFLTKIQIYKQLIKAFREEYEKDQHSEKFIEILGSLFFFNYFFDNILDKNLTKIKHRKRYDIVIASEIIGVMTDFVFPAIHSKTFLEDYNAVNYLNVSGLPQLRDFESVKAFFRNKNLKVALYEIYFSFLKLFNKSTFKVYSGEVYEKVKEFADTTNFKKLPSGFPKEIYIRTEMLKLFDRFHVFYSNHMLSKRGLYNKNTAVIIGEVFLPTNTIDLCKKIKDEYAWFDGFMKSPQNNSHENRGIIGKYLLKCLLATSYKYLKGILGYLTIMEKTEVIETLKLHCDEIVDLLQINEKKYTNLINNMLSEAINLMLAFRNEAESGSMVAEQQQQQQHGANSSKLGSFLNAEALALKNSTGPPSRSTFADTNFESDVQEERINPNLRLIRERINDGFQTLNKLYDLNGEYQFIIDRYVRSTELETYNSYMLKNLRSYHTLQAKYSSIHKRMNEAMVKEDQQILQLIKRRYRMKKAYYNQYPTENRFVIYLTKDNNSNDYSRSIAEFFVNQMVNMESCLVIVDYEQSFFLNDIYMQYIITMNNLLSWTDSIRKELFKIIYLSHCKKTKTDPDLEEKDMEGYDMKEVSEETIWRFVKSIWGAYLSLLMFVYFKPFMDQEWEEYWGKFFLVSNFIQNLCENNFVKFKSLFNAAGYGMIEMVRGTDKPGTRSIFFENYILLEVLAMNSNFWLNSDRKIVPSDRPELFLMIKRVMENVTEMLTGPSIENQLKIYIYRIDMWTGIINRIIDDIDSKFYEVKLACLLYISALLEGLDDRIVQFMGSNLEVHKLFDLIILMTKKLYIKQRTIERTKKRQVSDAQVAPGAKKVANKLLAELMNIAASHQAGSEHISYPSQLFHMYNKYEEFSEHIIMNIVITTFVLIKSMSTKIKFYELFLKDKDRVAKNYVTEAKSREEAVVFNFISRVIVDVEIVYESNQKKFLQKHYFKVPPRCFFLTDEMVDKYMEETPVDSITAKRNFLYNHVDALSIEMHENQKNYARFSRFSSLMTNDAFRIYQLTLIFLSIVLNIVMLVYLENPNGKGLESSEEVGNTVILALGIVIAVIAFICTVLWLLIKYHMEAKVRMAKAQAVSADPLKPREKLQIYLLQSLILHPRFSSFFLQFVFSILGILVNNIFFTLNLLLLTNLSKPINYIMKSIINHYDKLLVTLLLTILVIFSYSFLLLTNYSDSIDAGTFGEKVCENFVSCFINSVNLGLRLGGGIGDSLKIVSATAATGPFWGRFFFDLTFFILVRLILLNVVAGIIIDTFSDLRDQLTNKNKDTKNTCYVCGIDRSKLEQDRVDFDDHIVTDHNKWKYLFFIVKLSLADQRTFTGIEYSVWEKYAKNDSSWIPTEMYLKKGQPYRILEKEDKD